MSTLLESPELYDKIKLLGVPSPGVVKLSGHARSVGWDKKAGGAQDGESTTRKGKEACEFTATFYLVFDPVTGLDEFIMWNEGFVPVLRLSYESTAPVALDIYHPDLATLDIKSVVVKKLGGLQYDGKGGATVDVVFLEYFPPKKKPAKKPAGSKSKNPIGAQAGKPDPNAASKAELAALLAQAKAP